MNKQITFQNSCNFIYAAKQCCLFFEENLTKERILEFNDSQVIITQEEKDQYLVFQTEEGYTEYRFEENEFVKKRIIPSLKVYEEFSPKGSCYQMDIANLLYFLKATKNTLSTIHEEIDFELALRLRNSFFSSDDVVYVMFSWENGSILLCEKQNDSDVFSLSHQQELIKDQKALDKIREDLGNVPCTLKVLRSKPDDEDISLEIDSQDLGFDDSVIVTDMEIPRSKPNIIAITGGAPNAFKEDSIVTLDEPLPPLTSGDMAILEKYGIDTIKKKDLHKGILEGSVVIRDEELPQLGPDDIEVLKKYGIDIPDSINSEGQEEEFLSSNKQFVFEESQIPLDQELPSLGHDEVEIFKKYGVEISSEKKNTPRLIREAFEDSVVVKDDELPAIGPDDIHILNKYGINLVESPAQSKQPKQEQQHSKRVIKKVSQEIPQQPQSTSGTKEIKAKESIVSKPAKVKKSIDYKKWMQKNLTKKRVSGICITLFSLLFIYWGMIKYKEYDERQTQIQECNRIITSLDEHYQEIDSKVKSLFDIISQIKTKYPISLGYPEPSPKISQTLDNMIQENEKIKDVIVSANTGINQGKERNTLLSLKEQYKIYTDPEKKKNTLNVMENLKLKVSHTMTMAEYMYDIRTQEALVRRVLRRLREHIILFSQLFKTLDEKLEILKNQYPVKDSYPAPPKGSDKLASEMYEKISNWRNSSELIEKALLNEDNLRKALELSKVYEELESPDGTNAKNMIESVDQTLQICQVEAEKKAKRKEYFAILESVKKDVDAIEQELKSLEQGIKILNSFPKNIGIPQANEKTYQIKKAAENEVTVKKDTIEQSRNLLFQDEFDKAIETLGTIKSPSIFISLKEVKENINDTVLIAQSMKEKSEQGVKVAILLQAIKKQLLPLEQLTSNLEKQIDHIRTNFEPNKESIKFNRDSKYIFQSSQKLVEKLNAITTKVNSDIEKEQLDGAISILENAQSLNPQAESAIEKIRESLVTAESVIQRCEEIKYESEQLASIKAKSDKINDYLAQLKEQVKPLAKNIATMETDYPASEGYTAIPKNMKEKLNLGKNLITELDNQVATAKNAGDVKNWDKANQILSIYTKQDKLDPEFLAEISKYRYETEDIILESAKIGKNKSEVARIKDALIILKERRNGFKEVMTPILKIRKEWDKKYPAEKHFFPFSENMEALIVNANIEMQELDELVVDGEEYLHSGEYAKGVKLLVSYIDDVTSCLAAVGTGWSNLQKIVDKNERIINDPNYKEKVIERQVQEEVMSKIRDEWRKSPGIWYDGIEYYLDTLDSMQINIRNSLDSGSKPKRIYDELTKNMQVVRNIVDQMGELGVIVYKIEQDKGSTIQEILQKRQQEALDSLSKSRLERIANFVLTHNFEVDISDENLNLGEGVNLLRSLLDQSKKIADQDMKKASNALRIINIKYKQVYDEIQGELFTIQNN